MISLSLWCHICLLGIERCVKSSPMRLSLGIYLCSLLTHILRTKIKFDFIIKDPKNGRTKRNGLEIQFTFNTTPSSRAVKNCLGSIGLRGEIWNLISNRMLILSPKTTPFYVSNLEKTLSLCLEMLNHMKSWGKIIRGPFLLSKFSFERKRVNRICGFAQQSL